jgi:hypothetical protein
MTTTTTPRDLLDRFDLELLKVHFSHDETSVEECDYCHVRPMLSDLLEVWRSDNHTARSILWAIQDGYGVAGYTPDGEGMNWSGLRDSTPATIRRMWQAVHA